MSVSHEPAGAAGGVTVEPRSFLDALEEVSEAVEAGAGLPSVARAAGRALDASVIVLDARSSVLAVACASREDERAVMELEGDTRAVDLTVTQTDPGLKGDTASGGGTKPATLETGVKVQVPLFIEEGERVRVDTRSGEYVSRA